jgi:hypothetical protein
MNAPLGETVFFDAVTHDPATGQAANADSPPTWAVYAATGALPVDNGVMSQRLDGTLSPRTGHYLASFPVATVNGFSPGAFFTVVVEATIGGVLTKQVVMILRVMAAESDAGKVTVDNEAIADTVLSRNVSEVEAGAAEHSLCTIVLASLESSISSTEWIIRRTDGATVHATKIVTTDPNAEPVTGIS